MKSRTKSLTIIQNLRAQSITEDAAIRVLIVETNWSNVVVRVVSPSKQIELVFLGSYFFLLCICRKRVLKVKNFAHLTFHSGLMARLMLAIIGHLMPYNVKQQLIS